MQPSSHLWYLIVKPKCHGTGEKKKAPVHSETVPNGELGEL